MMQKREVRIKLMKNESLRGRTSQKEDTRRALLLGLRQTSEWNIRVHLSLYITCNKV